MGMWTAVTGFLLSAGLSNICMAQTCSQAGWFGNKCEFQCHCANNAECDQTTGACSNGCDPRWFGPACQYVASEFTLSGSNGLRSIEPVLPLDLVLDKDDSTCVSEYLQSVTATLKTPQPLTWIRVVSNSANLTQFQLLLYFEQRFHFSFIPCFYLRFAKVDDRTLDISCLTSTSIAKFDLNGPIVDGLCSLYINGGRNIALKQRAAQSSTFAVWVASNAVDGDPGSLDDYDYQRSTCSRTLGDADTSDSWQVTFSRAVEINWFQIYNRRNPSSLGCCEENLVNFTLQALPSSGANPIYSYRDPGGPAQDIYTVVPAPRIDFAVESVKIETNRNTLGFLTLCEVLVFGEVTCPAGKFGRQCERDCNCADQTEACFVSTGGCPSGCAPGYTGEDCHTLCPSGKHGFGCEEQCSVNCAGQNNLCSQEDGTCNEGCDAGYHNPKCDDGRRSGQGASGGTTEKFLQVSVPVRYPLRPRKPLV
ncbi:multiple epidermal growth factor-like domains protein 6 [Plakobranchus ocellatus]|uniref:Multiple epidermal growth factor-like domains protein 6 n=1 Tax=Plakobranchus ocellatus TaxID=259542 RepID=A0AAV3YTF5_9GAST|nr:multiple epidermal growth factor-like domains protein 6 [Plakobranchus ocellatus]